MTLLTEDWPLALVVAVLALILLYFLLRPRQRVSLTDSAPVRPHMSAPGKPEKPGVTSKAAAPPVRGAVITDWVRDSLPGASGPPDDLVKLKGIGPKLATLLSAQGITRFDQIASLSAAQIDGLDDTLGAFRGRLARDHVVDQARYLASGDIDGFEQRFGKL